MDLAKEIETAKKSHIVWFAHRYRCGWHIAQDVFQEATIALWQRPYIHTPQAWLKAVMRKKYFMLIRHEIRQENRELEYYFINPYTIKDDEETFDLLDELLVSHPESEQRLINLYFTEHKTQQEIAQIYRVSQSTISRIFDSLLHRLRDELYACKG